MSEYVPTTVDVRGAWIIAHSVRTPYGSVDAECRATERVAEFDRWLAQVRADAWDEGEQAGMRRADWEYGATPNMPKSNPYRQEADQ